MSEPGTGNKIIDFWVKQFEGQHGFRPLMEKRDVVLLHKLRENFDDLALTYAIKRYMKERDDFVEKTGWSVPAFKSRVQGYIAAYHRNGYARAAEDQRMGKVVGRILNGRTIPGA